MCMYLWMNLIKRTIDIQEKFKTVKFYVQRQWRVVLLWYHIFWQSSIQRGRHTQLCIITSLKWITVSKSAHTFTVGFIKLLSTHPIHIVVWGNFPFNRTDYTHHIDLKAVISNLKLFQNSISNYLVLIFAGHKQIVIHVVETELEQHIKLKW